VAIWTAEAAISKAQRMAKAVRILVSAYGFAVETTASRVIRTVSR
jgi:hypothetical protein